MRAGTDLTQLARLRRGEVLRGSEGQVVTECTGLVSRSETATMLATFDCLGSNQCMPGTFGPRFLHSRDGLPLKTAGADRRWTCVARVFIALTLLCGVPSLRAA